MKSASIAAGCLLAFVAGSDTSFAASNVPAISVGSEHGCTGVFPEKLFCWGNNPKNQVGAGPISSAFVTPIAVMDMVGLEDYSAGQATSCALKDGQVLCWGTNVPATNYYDTHMITPLTAYSFDSGVTDVEVGAAACVVKNGGIECWKATQQLPNPEPVAIEGLAPSDPILVSAISLSPGGVVNGIYHEHGCAVADAQAYCWGTNGSGELGTGDELDRAGAASVANLSANVSAIASGLMHSCALANGAVHCWGDNSRGQLGVAAPASSTTPIAVPALSSGVSGISAGAFHVCAIQYGTVYCWGNDVLEEADGSFSDSFFPIASQSFPYSATAIEAGYSMTCATTHSEFNKPGLVRCWGAGASAFNFDDFPLIWNSGFETAGDLYSN